MTETTVVHVHDPDGFDVYIGRAAPRAKDPRCRIASPFANLYTLRRYTLSQSLDEYEGMWRGWLMYGAPCIRQHYRMLLESLRGKRLGCWCKKKGREVPCHGDILVKLLQELKDRTL